MKLTALVNGFSLFKLPLLAFVIPKVVVASDARSVIKISLNWRTRNHLGTMYFGALAMGAELSIAVRAVQEFHQNKAPMNFIFKDFKCEFFKRADGDVHFICDEAAQVAELIAASLQSTERVERKFKGYATVPSKSSDPVMAYELTLSVKNKS